MSKSQNIRISDIAKMANVSKGTVDRVLHNRGRVSEEKQRRVEAVLKEINYQPNKIARFLVSRKTYSLAVIIPTYIKGEYWELVASGIKKAVEELKDFYVNVDYLYFDQYKSSSMDKLIDNINVDKYAGALIATLFKNHVIKLSKIFDDSLIPYIYIDANIHTQNNISYFGADSYMSGSIAAKFMMDKVGTKGTIIIVKVQHNEKEKSTQIESREKGFLEYLKKVNFLGKIHQFDFNLNEKDNAGENLEKLLVQSNESWGGIVFNSKIYEFVELLKQRKSSSAHLSLIGYDPIKKNIEALESGEVQLLISQRSARQGYDSIKALSNFLIFEAKIEKENYMPIDILIKENIKYYTD